MTETNQDPNQMASINEHLEKAGWRYVNAGACGNPYWYKRWDHAPRCHCNDDKPGIQAVITEYNHENSYRRSYEIDVTGELADGTWVKLMAYSLTSPDVMYGWEAQCQRLVKAWSLLATETKEAVTKAK